MGDRRALAYTEVEHLERIPEWLHQGRRLIHNGWRMSGIGQSIRCFSRLWRRTTPHFVIYWNGRAGRCSATSRASLMTISDVGVQTALLSTENPVISTGDIARCIHPGVCIAQRYLRLQSHLRTLSGVKHWTIPVGTPIILMAVATRWTGWWIQNR